MEMPQGGGHGQHASLSPPPLAPLSPPLSPASAAAAALANARWTPTKEQIAVLEGLYQQGLRTPTAEQIKQITARLREHGHIEGKNVFYWFQNHKARQRQKQKQQSFDYFARLLRRPPPLPVLHRPPAGHPFPDGPLPLPPPQMAMLPPLHPPPACNTGGVVYRPACYMAAAPQGAANAAYYPPPQMPVLYPVMEMAQDVKAPAQAPAATMYQTAPNNGRAPPHELHFMPASGGGGGGGGGRTAAEVCCGRETLQLFPLQPTFMLPDRTPRTGSATVVPTPSASASASFSGESESSESPNGEALTFYDFFGVHSGGC